MVQFENVTKEYGDVQALRNVSFEIPRGGIVGLLGPNGAGKTTSMRIMTGFLEPTTGTVRIGGEDFVPDRIELKRLIGYLPESAPTYGDMLAWDYLAYEARLHGLEPETRVPEVIREVGLGSHAHKPIRELSKGYRQRVGLAHTLIHDPELLVLDEPTSGLDPNQIIEVRALIRRIAETKTVILSTHIMQEVEALCDRVIVIHRGEIRYDGSIDGFAGNAQRIRLSVSGIESAAFASRLQSVEGIRSVEWGAQGAGPGTGEAPAAADRGAATGDETTDGAGIGSFMITADDGAEVRPAIFRAVVDGGGVIFELVRERTSMEDIFRVLTKEVGGGATHGASAGGAGAVRGAVDRTAPAAAADTTKEEDR